MSDSFSLEKLERDTDIFHKLFHSLIGIYIWEYVLSLDFDFAFLTRGRPFRWPMIFYFLNRYLLLGALIGILVSSDSDSTSKLNCQLLYLFNQLAGNASTIVNVNLGLRTIAVYGFSKPIIAVLVILILGHWSLILLGIQIKAVWNDNQHACTVDSGSHIAIMTATFVYSTCFTLIVFLLNAYRLYSCRKGQNVLGESRVVWIVFSDGLVYFFIAFLANLVATVVMLVRPSPVMDVVFNVPVVIVTTICATRTIRRLNNFFENDVSQVQNSTSGLGTTSGIRFTLRAVRDRHRSEFSGVATLSRPNTAGMDMSLGGGVHVQTETVTISEIGHFQKPDDKDADSDDETKAGSPI